MKRLALALAGLALTFLALPAPSLASSPGALQISLIEGDVQVRIPETGEWAPASINMPLLEDDEIWVPEGDRAELRLSNGSFVRLGGGAALQVVRVDSGAFQFSLTQGRAYALARGPRRNTLQIDSPSASVRAHGRAIFRIDIVDSDTDVSVYQGSVIAENRDGETRVTDGNTLTLGPDGYADLAPVGPADDWENWNAARDRRVLARRDAPEYLPDELRVYSSDFADNGRWVRVEEYGYVWTPTVVLVADWAPYRHGRWVWRGGDYVWISYDPWGWAPFHYGRWAFFPRIGWCWVPPERGQVYWGPGYVGWVRQGDYVAWVPLAPRETYYGRGNYGRYSVNVTNVNVTNIQVTNVYRNVEINNAVTVVNQTTFVTGRPAPVDRADVGRVRQDFRERRNIVVGRPEIRPTAASYVPVVRAVPEVKRPPAPIREIKVDKIREGRPLVREPDRSAIRPGAPPKPLEVRRSETPRTFPERGRERRTLQPSEGRGTGRPAEPARPGSPAARPEPGKEREGRPQQQERVSPQPPQERQAPGREPQGRPQQQERVRPQPPQERQAPDREPQGRPQQQERVRPQPPQERQAPDRESQGRPQQQERVRPQPSQERQAPDRESQGRPQQQERVRPQPPQERQAPGRESQGRPQQQERVRPQERQAPAREPQGRPQQQERVRPQPPQERVRPPAPPRPEPEDRGEGRPRDTKGAPDDPGPGSRRR